jgi:hypothetical protein
MLRTASVQVGALTAIAEDGREFRIYVFQPSADYEMEWLEGETELWTRDEEAVRYLEPGHYEVQTPFEQVAVKCIDSQAP